jgi:hypothetical protein
MGVRLPGTLAHRHLIVTPLHEQELLPHWLLALAMIAIAGARAQLV